MRRKRQKKTKRRKKKAELEKSSSRSSKLECSPETREWLDRPKRTPNKLRLVQSVFRYPFCEYDPEKSPYHPFPFPGLWNTIPIIGFLIGLYLCWWAIAPWFTGELTIFSKEINAPGILEYWTIRKSQDPAFFYVVLTPISTLVLFTGLFLAKLAVNQWIFEVRGSPGRRNK
jgi:hypothetical protein